MSKKVPTVFRTLLSATLTVVQPSPKYKKALIDTSPCELRRHRKIRGVYLTP